MLRTRLAIAVVVCAGPALAQKDAGQNLIKNGGFESGGTHDAAHWDEIWPKPVLKTPPRFDRSGDRPRGGKACVALTVPEAGGYCSFTQTIASPPKGAKSVHVEGWIDFTPDPKTSGTPSFVVWFDVPSSKDGGSVAEAKLPKDARGWTKVAFDAAVPEGATQWLVRCGMLGCGTARFDDVVVTASSRPTEAVALIEAHGDYELTETGSSVTDPWIDVAIPFPFEGQTPLAVRVTSEPPDRIVRLAVAKDEENRHLRIHLKPAGKGEKTDLRVDALVMVRNRPQGKGEGVALAPRGKLPADVKRFFEPTPGIDAEDKDIRGVAKAVRADTMEHAIEDVLAWMRAHFKYEGGGDQGGRASFERKYAVCTGHANLAASMFQAAGVPCRVLGCLMGDRLQEHYIVEVWAPNEGWRRVESTSKAFPIPDSAHLILHVAHPKFHRSGGNVPLLIRGADDCTAGFRMGSDTCWQGMSTARTVGVDVKDAETLEKLARDAFLAWEKKPATTGVVRLAPEAVSGLSPRGAAVLEPVGAFASAKPASR